jgi:energy-coupling factor transporter ATP-binding protein EcfA2
MRLRSVELQNFKRFTDLRIENIPDSARLVLMIGANGSGKSSVFDAFDSLSHFARTNGQILPDGPYYRKNPESASLTKIVTSDGHVLRSNVAPHPQDFGDLKKFYGRSSVRVVPRNQQVNADPSHVESDRDAPGQFIEPDIRFNADVQIYTENINRLLREPVFANINVNPREIFAEQIEPLNAALLRVFGDSPAIAIQLAQFQSAELNKAPVLEFRKGSSRITYDLLSHGEKQVVILLLNFMVRSDHLQDKVIFIDEMDGHMHRSLQYRLLEEIVEHWIPENSQLWTASHALGFIEYATASKFAAVLDFDELDFDQPQVIFPVEPSRPEVFDIAIDRALIGRLASLVRVVLVKGKDTRFLRHCNLSTSFVRADNKQSAFLRAQQLADEGITCLVDRDYLTDQERLALLTDYPFLRMLKSYCIENELYHPENVREAKGLVGKRFDIDEYRLAWAADLAANRSDITANVNAVRQTYGYFFPETVARKAFIGAGGPIVDRLQSSSFDDFFPYLSAKTYGTKAKSLVGIAAEELAKTQHFRERIQQLLAP